jgi:hypothetical protein
LSSSLQGASAVRIAARARARPVSPGKHTSGSISTAAAPPFDLVFLPISKAAAKTVTKSCCTTVQVQCSQGAHTWPMHSNVVIYLFGACLSSPDCSSPRTIHHVARPQSKVLQNVPCTRSLPRALTRLETAPQAGLWCKKITSDGHSNTAANECAVQHRGSQPLLRVQAPLSWGCSCNSRDPQRLHEITHFHTQAMSLPHRSYSARLSSACKLKAPSRPPSVVVYCSSPSPPSTEEIVAKPAEVTEYNGLKPVARLTASGSVEEASADTFSDEASQGLTNIPVVRRAQEAASGAIITSISVR